MKKTLIVVGLAVVVFGLYFVFGDCKSCSVTQEDRKEDLFRPDASSATFIFEDGPITLSNGRSETKIPDSSMIDEIELTQTIAYGDLNNDGEEDSVVILTETSGGSGTFIYVAGFVSGPVAYKGTNAVFLGDRIAPQSLSISNGILTIQYLDRGENEAMANEPTIPVTKKFILKSGSLQESGN